MASGGLRFFLGVANQDDRGGGGRRLREKRRGGEDQSGEGSAEDLHARNVHHGVPRGQPC